MTFLFLFLICVGEVILYAVVRAKTEDENKGALAGHCFNVFAGTFLYEYTRQNIQYDDFFQEYLYDYNGTFYDFEKWHYFANYLGLALALAGVVGVIWVFYKALTEKAKE